MSSLATLPASGRITRGIRENTLVDQTVSFVETQLPRWRDDLSRPHALNEEDLNGQLCKYLNDRARDDFPMAIFHHEERQGSRRRVDLSVLPSSTAILAGIYQSIYNPYFVIEGKRLPAPSAARKREYLTGLAKQSGGVQRFRLGMHGSSLRIAALVGYVQKGSVAEWVPTINAWITELSESDEDTTCKWDEADFLGEPTVNGVARLSRCESNHTRATVSTNIQLIHLWLHMGIEA